MFPLEPSGAPALPYNVRALTRDNKVTGTRHLMVSQTDCALVVFVYFSQLDFADASFLVVGHPVHGAVGALADRAKLIAPEDQASFSRKSEPRIVLAGPDTIDAGGVEGIISPIAGSRPAGYIYSLSNVVHLGRVGDGVSNLVVVVI